MRRRTNLRLATYLLLPALMPLIGAAVEPAKVSIEGQQYVPAEVKIRRGETVTWVNNDDRDHIVRAGDGSFESPRLLPGETFSRKFDVPGDYRIGCPIHPRERGVVIVE